MEFSDSSRFSQNGLLFFGIIIPIFLRISCFFDPVTPRGPSFCGTRNPLVMAIRFSPCRKVSSLWLTFQNISVLPFLNCTTEISFKCGYLVSLPTLYLFLKSKKSAGAISTALPLLDMQFTKSWKSCRFLFDRIFDSTTEWKESADINVCPFSKYFIVILRTEPLFTSFAKAQYIVQFFICPVPLSAHCTISFASRYCCSCRTFINVEHTSSSLRPWMHYYLLHISRKIKHAILRIGFTIFSICTSWLSCLVNVGYPVITFSAFTWYDAI